MTEDILDSLIYSFRRVIPAEDAGIAAIEFVIADAKLTTLKLANSLKSLTAALIYTPL